MKEFNITKGILVIIAIVVIYLIAPSFNGMKIGTAIGESLVNGGK